MVFNASSSAKNELSLHESLMEGPVIQKCLFEQLIKLRESKICFTTDIVKMYRMVWVAPEDRCMQRILWRENLNDPIQEYELNTITYGTTPASFISTKCLDVVASKIEKTNPVAAQIIRNNFYMGDLICCHSTLQDAVEVRTAVHDALAAHGFILRKYSSNSDEFMDTVWTEAQAENKGLIAVLGLLWHRQKDILSIKIDVEQLLLEVLPTKRIILSIIAGIFDPLGIFAPVTIHGKLIIQSVWTESQLWNKPVSEPAAAQFRDFVSELIKLKKFSIPRHIPSAIKRELVIFCDGSLKAYCAAYYLSGIDESGQVASKLLFSTNRVVPLCSSNKSKPELTIPKIELCAAKLATVQCVLENLDISDQDVHAFTDSTTVLCWLSKPSTQWKTFVQNRVKCITKALPFQSWQYVHTTANPADLGTHGISADELSQSSLWSNRPNFLHESNWLDRNALANTDLETALERSCQVNFVGFISCDNTLVRRLAKYSDFRKLVRITTYIIRAITRVKSFRSSIIGTKEFENAWFAIVKLMQVDLFRVEIECLSKNAPLKKKSLLRSLCTFLDSAGLLRVGGRLNHVLGSDEFKHPLVLNARQSFVEVFVRYLHLK